METEKQLVFSSVKSNVLFRVVSLINPAFDLKFSQLCIVQLLSLLGFELSLLLLLNFKRLERHVSKTKWTFDVCKIELIRDYHFAT